MSSQDLCMIKTGAKLSSWQIRRILSKMDPTFQRDISKIAHSVKIADCFLWSQVACAAAFALAVDSSFPVASSTQSEYVHIRQLHPQLNQPPVLNSFQSVCVVSESSRVSGVSIMSNMVLQDQAGITGTLLLKCQHSFNFSHPPIQTIHPSQWCPTVRMCFTMDLLPLGQESLV